MSAVFKQLDHLVRLDIARDVRFDKKVDELRQRYRNVRFHTFLVLEEKSRILVSTRIPDLPDRSPNRQLACGEVQAFYPLKQVRARAAKVIAQAFKSNAQQDACRPRRIVKNLLCFFVRGKNFFRHVLGCRDPNWLRPYEFRVRKKRKTAAMRALCDAQLVARKHFCEVPKTNFLGAIEPVKEVLNPLVAVNLFNNGMREVLAEGLAVRANKGQIREVV